VLCNGKASGKKLKGWLKACGDANEFEERKKGLQSLVNRVTAKALLKNARKITLNAEHNEKQDVQIAAHDAQISTVETEAKYAKNAVVKQDAKIAANDAQITVLAAHVHMFERLTVYSQAVELQLSVRLLHINFSLEVKRHSGRYFAGTRLDVMEAFGKFFGDPGSSRVFCIKGAAGIGKSTILGMLCNEFAANIVGVHFCQHNDVQRKSARNVITSLAYQLSLRLPAYGKVLDAQLKENPTFDARNDDMAMVIDTLLIEPLGAVDVPLDGMTDEQKEGQRGGTDFVKLVLLIDALDENEQSGANALLVFLRDKVSMLPAWLAAVVTSRPETEIVAALAKYAPLEIECGSIDKRDDIVRFVTHKVHELIGTGADSEEAVQLLCEKAEGMFVYVAKVFEHHQTLSMEYVRALPKGMAAFVLASMERVRVQWEADKKDDMVEAEWDDVMQCLRIVLTAREPLTVAALVELVDGVVFQEDVERFVDALALLFPLRKTGDDFDVIEPYHKSVPDALTDEAVNKKQRSNELRYRHLSFVDLAAGDALLSTACLRVLRSSDAADGDGGAFVLSVERALAAANETHKAVRYAVRHAGEHLVAVVCFQDAAMLLCNLQIIELRVALESYNDGVYALLHEYFRLAVALQKARDGNADLTTRVDEYIRFVRTHRTALRDAPKQTGGHAFNFP
jgi:hypothetical protein